MSEGGRIAEETLQSWLVKHNSTADMEVNISWRTSLLCEGLTHHASVRRPVPTKVNILQGFSALASQHSVKKAALEHAAKTVVDRHVFSAPG